MADILRIRTVIVSTSKTSQAPLIIPFVPQHGIRLSKPGSKHTVEGHLETCLIGKNVSLRSLQRLLDEGEIRLEYQRVLPNGTVVPLLQADSANPSAVEPPTIQSAHDEGAGVTAAPAPSTILPVAKVKPAPIAPVMPVNNVKDGITDEEKVAIFDNEPEPSPVEEANAVEALLNSATDISAEPPAEPVQEAAEPVVESPKKRRGRPKKNDQSNNPTPVAAPAPEPTPEVAPEPTPATDHEDVLSVDTL